MNRLYLLCGKHADRIDENFEQADINWTNVFHSIWRSFFFLWFFTSVGRHNALIITKFSIIIRGVSSATRDFPPIVEGKYRIHTPQKQVLSISFNFHAIHLSTRPPKNKPTNVFSPALPLKKKLFINCSLFKRKTQRDRTTTKKCPQSSLESQILRHCTAHIHCTQPPDVPDMRASALSQRIAQRIEVVYAWPARNEESSAAELRSNFCVCARIYLLAARELLLPRVRKQCGAFSCFFFARARASSIGRRLRKLLRGRIVDDLTGARTEWSL